MFHRSPRKVSRAIESHKAPHTPMAVPILGQCFEGVLLIKNAAIASLARDSCGRGLERVPEAFHHQPNLLLAELAEGLGDPGTLRGDLW